ncbi:MAG: exodeoxyribonuclease III [Bdellovibrionota bacterium]|nr:exodeoxyribonuclease III [Bdellovibrionota bacterium]
MKIISWNVNGIRACLKKGMLDFLETEKPDIFCVQETKAHREQVELTDIEFGFESSIWSEAQKKGYSGTASFFLEQPKSTEVIIGEDRFDTEGRFVVSDHGEFLLYNIYYPNGAASDERHFFKMDFLDMLYQHLKQKLSEGREIIVVGDYNIAHTKIDIHDPVRLNGTSGFKPEEREWMDRFFDLGFVDSFRHFHPKETDRYSWWSYRAGARERNKGWRIDYMSVSPGLVDRLKSADILKDVMGSDHCPLVLELKDF